MAPKGKGKKKSNSSVSMTAPSRSPKHRRAADKLMMRFYEPLVLQYVLDPTRGSRIHFDELASLDESDQSDCKFRRSFVNSLAYICDFDTGGATVTAIALQMKSAGVVFWVAANENVKSKVLLFLKGILRNLAGLNGAEGEESTASVFKCAVELGMRRVKSYWRFMQEPLKKCLKVLEDEQSQGLIKWLSSFEDRKADMLQLCRFSYDARASPYMKELAKRSKRGATLACTEESNASNFWMVRHLIGRLGSHMRAARTIVAAAMAFPAFFDDFEIQYLPSPKPAETPPPMDDRTTLNGIVARMLKNDEDLLSYQEGLQDMDTKFPVYGRVVEEYKRPTFLPRVHAELLLLEHFHAHQYEFVNGDKYIGCSKPACYCCYHYICAHPGNFVRPASHNKTYLNWRPPDVDADRLTATHTRDIINTMLITIRKDVLAQIKSQRPRGRSYPDSTTGITASKREGSSDASDCDSG